MNTWKNLFATKVTLEEVTEELDRFIGEFNHLVETINFNDYSSIVLLADWVNHGLPYNEASYTVNTQGLVVLKGVIKNGRYNNGVIIGSIPSAHAPKHTQVFTVVCNNSTARIDIEPTGAIKIYNASSNLLLSLDGIVYVRT